MYDHIILKGVKSNNLKNIDISIPKNKITTITGVSGSGKSTLAFDTVYKEGQFRYIESLSSYLRQFFNLGERPDIDYSEGFSPAIAIEQNKKIGNSRSTVGTLTEIDDYLRLLFSKLGDIYCYKCGEKIHAKTTDQISSQILEKYSDEKVYIVSDFGKISSETDFFKFVRKNRRRVDAGKGAVRFLVELNNSDIVEYFYMEDPKITKEYFPVRIYGVFDRITLSSDKFNRLKEDVVKVLGDNKKVGVYFDNKIEWHTDKNFCPSCDISYPDFSSQHFSPNRQEGACQTCHGIGKTLQVDFEKIIDTNSKYLEAILPWRDSAMGQGILEKLADKYSIDTNLVRKNMPDWFKDIVINGDKQLLRIGMGGKYVSMYYKGIEDILTQQYQKGILTVDFQAMLELRECPTCGGAKLRKESLNVFLSVSNTKYNIFDLQNIGIKELVTILKKFKKNTSKSTILAERIANPLIDRCDTINKLGLEHISLSRQIGTLSGGEVQRLRLAKQLGNRLTGIIYVLDEPTIGLDDKEIKKTIKAIKQLKQMGNTIIVVEHNEEFINQSDWIVEIGPGAGDFGGEVVYSGDYKKFLKQNTVTSSYLVGDSQVVTDFDHKPSNDKISIKKASKFNLKNLDVEVNLGSFTIITGASGAGKTTLMYETLYRFLNEKEKFIQGYIRLHLLKSGYSRTDIITKPVLDRKEYEHLENVATQEFFKEIGVETIKGTEKIKNVLYVDQSSIGKTPRSCPATFIGVFDDIRKLFASSTDAKMLGFDSGYFSFNSKKGACPECDGYGHKKVELQFLPDTYVACELCKGKRYKSEILSIKWNGKTISDVLDMYIKDAIYFFDDIEYIKDKLELMNDIGLGYLKLGQPAHTLSGGESQRIKLVKHLLKSYKGHTVYFLDEPTVGLHPQDIQKLLNVLKRFLDKSDTILMIEHDKNLLQFADKVIRLENGSLLEDD
ncbi:excinuclease ABC subunit UvrA [Candidatus Absconditicoccus praedator]|uniref:excinuclease ABC subunit UvrA n=1 Tax=Candidatus Absconditicoccus praedator TaxID=2735562 RepID=UPI001E28B8B0|nr:excinuclease ABC subunit UvrA [Candidatus Absconditicoccus praedator]UFX83003.1 excinuclease ABC subunit UvrA [Candidatus Absconditicoccus praedator]